MVIDFKEIQDDQQFENFCMHLLETMGFKIPVPPAVGPDGGRDIICEEVSGLGVRGRRWLVSCKHFAQSGRAVGNSDDQANINKLVEHGCEAFMFFFSTPYSESFRTSVDNVCMHSNKQYIIFNVYDIEKLLLSAHQYYPLFQQYFPESFQRMFENRTSLHCGHSGFGGEELYAVFTDQAMYEYELYCEQCLQPLVEYLNYDNIPYTIVTVRH